MQSVFQHQTKTSSGSSSVSHEAVSIPYDVTVAKLNLPARPCSSLHRPCSLSFSTPSSKPASLPERSQSNPYNLLDAVNYTLLSNRTTDLRRAYFDEDERDDKSAQADSISQQVINKKGSNNSVTDEQIQFSTHELDDPETTFPNDDDGYFVVRRFLYTILTIADWGISEICPAAIRATVGNWYGTGFYFRERFQNEDLDDVCPKLPSLVNGEQRHMDAAEVERIRDLITSCVVREARRHMVRKLEKESSEVAHFANRTSFGYSKRIGASTINDDSIVARLQETDTIGNVRKRSRASSRPRLPEEWHPRQQVRRSSSVYSQEIDSAHLCLQSTENLLREEGSDSVLAQPSSTSLPAETMDTCREMEDISSMNTSETVPLSQPSQPLLPHEESQRKHISFLQDFISLVGSSRSPSSPSATAQARHDRLYELQSVRFENTLAGPTPATEKLEQRQHHGLPTHIKSIRNDFDSTNTEVQEGAKHRIQPTSLLVEAASTLRLDKRIISRPTDVRHVASAVPLDCPHHTDILDCEVRLSKRKSGNSLHTSNSQTNKSSHTVPAPHLASWNFDETESGKRFVLARAMDGRLAVQEVIGEEVVYDHLCGLLESGLRMSQARRIVSRKDEDDGDDLERHAASEDSETGNPVVVDTRESMQSDMQCERASLAEDYVSDKNGPTTAMPDQSTNGSSSSHRLDVVTTESHDDASEITDQKATSGKRCSQFRAFGKRLTNRLRRLRAASVRGRKREGT